MKFENYVVYCTMRNQNTERPRRAPRSSVVGLRAETSLADPGDLPRVLQV